MRQAHPKDVNESSAFRIDSEVSGAFRIDRARQRQQRAARAQPLPLAVEQLERAMIDAALKKTGGLEDAAKLPGISRKGLFLKRKRWGIEEAD